MIGRQVIPINQGMTLDELLTFMQVNWDVGTHNAFRKGRPTAVSIEEYILLPATGNYLVAVYPRKAGRFFSKDNKIVLTVCDSPEGIESHFAASIPTRNIFFGVEKIEAVMSREKERKGPAERALQFYTAYMKELLEKAGLC